MVFTTLLFSLYARPILILWFSLRDCMRTACVDHSPSMLLKKKMHHLLEIFVVDIPLHGALANFRCAMLESTHGWERDMNEFSNKQFLEQIFATKVFSLPPLPLHITTTHPKI